MDQYRILVIEDEFGVREMIRMYLEKKNYYVQAVGDGTRVMTQIDQFQPDLILLDIEMPGLDGFTVCEQIRAEYHMPIIFLSVRRETVDKVKSLELGGDDYVTKPFEFVELEARIKANLRRTRQEQQTNQLIYGDLKIDLNRYVCYLKQTKLTLSKKEMELLILLAQQPERVWSSEQLYDQVWGIDSTGNIETVKVHISTLRKKIEADPAKPKYIKTVRGFGYVFHYNQENE